MNGEGIDAERMQQLREIEETKRRLLSKVLTREAYERLARVRMVNPETAGQVELYLIQLYQAGKLPGEISDGQLRELLKALSSKKEMRIKRA